jgi:hypothetical protein
VKEGGETYNENDRGRKEGGEIKRRRRRGEGMEGTEGSLQLTVINKNSSACEFDGFVYVGIGEHHKW